jgi:L-threonylcarbamoyladenylate synthase
LKTAVYHLEEQNYRETAAAVCTVLVRGGVCVIPTDTVYGMVALDGFQDSIDRIYRIKQRPRDKQLIRLIGDPGCVSDYSDQRVPGRLKRFWPGPLTIVFRAHGGGSIALRYPDDRFLGLIFAELGKRTIVAPSANLSGGEPPAGCGELVELFEGKVEIIVCGKQNQEPGKASTIVDISRRPWRVLRQGSLRLP